MTEKEKERKENLKREQGTNVTIEWKGILNVRNIQT